MNTPFLQVFTAKIPKYTGETLYPQARQEEISSVKNEKTRTEKYGVWKLLQYAVEKTLSRPFTEFVFTKNTNGKWLCKDFYFSLSHSKNAVAVAISSAPVGVDIQKDQPLQSLSIAKKMLTEEEYKTYQNLPKTQMNAYLVGTWTKKEAAFKRSDENRFTPTKIQLSDTENCIKTKIEDEEYFLSTSSTLLHLLSIHENVIL